MDEKILIKYREADQCPVRNVLDRIGNKWSMLILMVLGEGEVMRFNELHKYISTISQKMLTVTLKTLESDGLIQRTIYPQVPPKVEYRLTERGRSLLPYLHGLAKWANQNMTDIKESRKQFAAAEK